MITLKNIIKSEISNFIFENEEYFTQELPDDIKQQSHEYRGRGVIWYGDPHQMIVVSKDNIEGMWGNMYDSEKLQYVEDLIRNSDEYVELECSYAMGSVYDFQDVLEEQTSFVSDNFNVDYDGKETPASIGDEELDNYIGVDEIDDSEILNWISWDDIDLYRLLNDNRFFLVKGKTVKQLNEDVKQLRIKNREEIGEDLTKVDFEFIKEFINVETRIKNAVDNQDGDIGVFSVQLRDGHHRVMGAIAAGEQYVCVNLDKDDITRFAKYIQRV